MIGRDVARRGTRRLEIARSVWRKFIVRFGIHIIEVAKKPQLIVADFVLKRRITAQRSCLGNELEYRLKLKPGNMEAGLVGVPLTLAATL